LFGSPVEASLDVRQRQGDPTEDTDRPSLLRSYPGLSTDVKEPDQKLVLDAQC
jgi:hypothetical protein